MISLLLYFCVSIVLLFYFDDANIMQYFICNNNQIKNYITFNTI
nr:MAG TPA: hypothetical protein [Caudoviricetes sp.]